MDVARSFNRFSKALVGRDSRGDGFNPFADQSMIFEECKSLANPRVDARSLRGVDIVEPYLMAMAREVECPPDAYAAGTDDCDLCIGRSFTHACACRHDRSSPNSSDHRDWPIPAYAPLGCEVRS